MGPPRAFPIAVAAFQRTCFEGNGAVRIWLEPARKEQKINLGGSALETVAESRDDSIHRFAVVKNGAWRRDLEEGAKGS